MPMHSVTLVSPFEATQVYFKSPESLVAALRDRLAKLSAGAPAGFRYRLTLPDGGAVDEATRLSHGAVLHAMLVANTPLSPVCFVPAPAPLPEPPEGPDATEAALLADLRAVLLRFPRIVASAAGSSVRISSSPHNGDADTPQARQVRLEEARAKVASVLSTLTNLGFSRSRCCHAMLRTPRWDDVRIVANLLLENQTEPTWDTPVPTAAMDAHTCPPLHVLTGSVDNQAIADRVLAAPELKPVILLSHVRQALATVADSPTELQHVLGHNPDARTVILFIVKLQFQQLAQSDDLLTEAPPADEL
jgi:hypothetical protein